MALLEQLPTEAFRQTEAARAGISSRELYRFRDAGAIEEIGRGLYRRTDLPPVDLDLLEISRRNSRSTLCLTSALAHHDLIDTIPSKIEIAIPRGSREPATQAPTRWHQFDRSTFDLERSKMAIDGTDSLIGIYSAERSIIDAFRLRGLIGYEISTEALKSWLRRRNSRTASLIALSKKIPRSSQPLMQALEYLS